MALVFLSCTQERRAATKRPQHLVGLMGMTRLVRLLHGALNIHSASLSTVGRSTHEA